MADSSPIDIQLTDNITTGPRDKLLDLAKAATSANSAIDQLNAGLGRISNDAVAQLTRQTQAASSGLVRQIQNMAQAGATIDKLTSSNKTAAASYDRIIQGLSDYTNASNIMVRGMSLAGQVATQQNVALAATKGAIGGATASLVGHTHAVELNRASQLELLHISRALFDSISAGISPLRAFTMEAGRIGQVAASSGGIGNVFSSIAGTVGRFINPTTIGIAALTAALALGAAAFNSYENQVAATNGALQGAGRNVGSTSREFIALTAAAGNSGEISTSAANDLGVALARTGKLSSDNIASIIGVSKNLAATLGVSFDAAKQVLIKTFSDPAKGIETLDAQLNFLDATTKRTVADLIAQGRQQEGIALALSKLPSALANAEQATTSWSRAWDAVAVTASNAFQKVGAAIDRATGFSGPKAPAEQLTDLQKQLAVWQGILSVQQQEADKLKQIGASDAQIAALIPTFQTTKDRVSDLTTQLEKLRTVTEAVTQTAQAAARATAQIAQEQTLGKQISELAAATAPANRQLDELRNKLELLNQRSLNTPIEDQRAYRQAVDDTTRAVTTYLDPAAKQAELNRLELLGVNALTAGQRAKLAADLARVGVSGQLVNSQEAELRAQGAANLILAEVAKVRREEFEQLDREAGLYGLVGTQRAIATQLLERELSARRSGNAFSPTELAALEAKLQKQAALNAVQQQTDAIYNASIKPVEDYNNTLIAATNLLNQGRISQEQFNSAVADSKIKMLDAAQTMSGGFQSALLSVSQQYNNVAGTIKTGFEGAARSVEDALVTMTTTGKFNVADLAKQIETEVARMTIRLLILRPLLQSIASFLPGGAGLAGGGSTAAGYAAAGTSLGGGGSINVLPAAATGLDMIVQGASGRDRNILPIRVSKGERVTVQTPQQQAAGGQGVGNVAISVPAPIVNVHNAPAGTSVQTSKGSDGASIIDVIINSAKDAVASDIMRGGTKLNKAHEARYGLSASRGNLR
jgi:phage-related minor tail protein